MTVSGKAGDIWVARVHVGVAYDRHDALNNEAVYARHSLTSELWLLSGGKRGDYQNCSVLYCVLKVVHCHKHT